MESLMEQYGFDDHLFLSETPDILRCVVCSLVLRDPVQILTCGHKFCTKCFDWMKSYAESKNTEFCCPVDREVVDMSKVYEDVAVKRAVGNLRTRCDAHEDGCSWNGDLRELEKHSKQCSFQKPQHIRKGGTIETDKMISDLCSKVARCETWMADKDREMADKDKENVSLKYQVQQLREELHSFKQQIQGEYATRYEVLDLKNELKEQKNSAASLKAENKSLKTMMESLTAQLVSLHQQHSNSSCQSTSTSKKTETTVESVTPQLVSLHQPANNSSCQSTSTSKKMETTVESSTAQLVSSHQEDKKLSFQSTSMSKILEARKLSPKSIVIVRHRGDHDHIIFSGQGNSCVQFKGFSTVSIPTVSVRRGTKAWYEVKFIDVNYDREAWRKISLYTGWASSSLTKVDHHIRKGVGHVSQSYGFDPVFGDLWVKGEYEEGYPSFDDKEQGGYVGVALDMVEGTVSYSVNGVWFQVNDTDVVSRFHRINLNTVFFPALSGENVTIDVNFGDRPFMYSPPDDSYSSLVEIA